jgi:hypothetical protein
MKQLVGFVIAGLLTCISFSSLLRTLYTGVTSNLERRENGELLTAPEAAGFEVLVTTDRTLRSQQKLAKRRIG